MTGSWPATPARGARRRRWASSGPTSRRPSRSGRSTRPSPKECGQRSCSLSTSGCAWPSAQRCGSPTSTWRRVSSIRRCSGRRRNSRASSPAPPSRSRASWRRSSPARHAAGTVRLSSTTSGAIPGARGRSSAPCETHETSSTFPMTYRFGSRREGRAGATAACIGQDHPRHLRRPLA